MKKFSLIFLMCFSVGLQGSRFTPFRPAQQQASTGYAIALTAKNDLALYSNKLSDLLDNIERALCGSASSLSLNNPGGLSIDSSGAYVNCNGGLLFEYNSIASSTSYLLNKVSNENYKQGFSDCLAGNIPSLVSGIQTLSSDAVSIANIMGQPAPSGPGYDVVWIQNSTTVVAGQAGSGVVTINGLGDAINSAINSIGINLNASAILTASANLNSVIDTESAVFNEFSACQTEAVTAGTCSSNYDPYTGACDGACVNNWCPTTFRDYLISWQAISAAYQALYNSLAKYQPTDIINYSIQQVLPSTVGCYGPNIYQDPIMANQSPSICTASGCNINTVTVGNAGGADCSGSNFSCDSVSDCGGTLNGYVCEILNQTDAIKNDITVVQNEFNNANIRTTAIMNSVNALVEGFGTVSTQLNSVASICNTDIADEKKYIEIVSTGFNLLLGLLIGSVVFTGIGALGVPFLEPLCMVLTSVPEINDYTVGWLGNLATTEMVNNEIKPTAGVHSLSI